MARRLSIRSHLTLSCLTAILVTAWCNDAAAELQWRRGRVPGHTAAQTQHQDASVRQVAYDNSQAAEPIGQATLRSVIVDRGDQPDAIRSAQLPSATSDSRYEEQLREPFAGVPGPVDSSLDGQFDESQPMQAPDGEIVPGVQEMQQRSIQPPSASTSAAPSEPPTTADPFESEPSGQTTEPSGEKYVLGATSMTDEARKAQEFCSHEFEGLKASTLRDVSLTIVVTGSVGTDYPYECSIDDGTQYPERCWPQTTYMWKASALCHKPLYFENESLERYGHSWGPYVQPLVSGAHFFSRLPILPYEMGLEPPNECIYALGHYRPGSCAPYLIDPVPFTWRAALFEAGAVVGTVFVLP
jgi:hypothetical protein